MHPLRDSVFRWLFAAQVLSLLGIGIMTVGLALHAYELGGAKQAGKILGALFALKMVVYVGLALLPGIGSLAFGWPGFLVLHSVCGLYATVSSHYSSSTT